MDTIYQINQLVSKTGETLYNVPAEPYILYEMGFGEDEAAQLCHDAIHVAKWEQVRVKRDTLITRSDWTQMPDVSLTDEQKQAFVAYRQTLRDIPQNYTDPDDVIWPELPVTESSLA
ncbi:tail fiber assembly protein [Vibrio mangrovi]|uniref:Tail fiber assembly protein n=1 Tax=Vibrio mangrovi TaxID=474394 RepID=A0A1Y6ITQ9_9VIBR|nr:tail fiber assembly protein [Vibrio mangrovi]MDW6004715.1 tail fiber assembly protein [Vibrio mangrovi]SMS01006.1 hypothetical protein VIM7927_02283 [Vibrio mangrovi]